MITPLEQQELIALLSQYYAERPTPEQNQRLYRTLLGCSEEWHKAGHTVELQQIHDNVRAKYGLEPVERRESPNAQYFVRCTGCSHSMDTRKKKFITRPEGYFCTMRCLMKHEGRL